ncbi:MAG: fumarate hydratase [Ruminiclostridium sp.]|nr:fumarate hydratase [Ruminiclostridium sp.]
MRRIDADTVVRAVERLCTDANYYLNADILQALQDGISDEISDTGRNILSQLVENASLAREKQMAICQDTGMAVVFVELGQDVHVSGGNLTNAINEGVRRGYKNGYLRNSVVNDPVERVNTGDNTPAVIHYDIVDGENIRIIVAPKGFGSENMSGVKMLKPSDGREGIKGYILDMVDRAGPNPCPPIIVGVGIGGTMEKAALLAKKALLRPVNDNSGIEYLCKLEKELLKEINSMGIGPAGLGGRITALGVNIEAYPTHIAGLPVAVNIGCHATRHAEVVL